MGAEGSICVQAQRRTNSQYTLRICSSWEKLKRREQVINGQKEEKEDEKKGWKRRRAGQITKELIAVLRVLDFILVALGDQ